MAEKDEKSKAKEFNPDDRYRYLGFEVKPGKIGELFKSDSEKDSLIKRILERRKSGARVREHNTLEEARVSGTEKIVLTVTSVLIVLSLLLPWFSGYHEVVVEQEPVAVQEQVVEQAAVPSDSLSGEALTDSARAAAMQAGEAMPPVEGEMAATEEVAAPAAQEVERDEAGFASITSHQKRTEIKREHDAISGLGALGLLGSAGGKIFSSGFVLILATILIIVYMLSCLALAGYNLFTIYTTKGDVDTVALKLKKVLRLNFIPILIYVFGIIISVPGASYSFDTTGMLAQIGESYGIGTYLGLLSYGFYLSLCCFILNAVKSVEI
jgi:hypothetical protein